MNLPVVAIIGRPNVGKSTLFNRILRRRLAVTADEPGITRDRLYARTDWTGKEFYIVDTGGYVPESDDEIDRMVTAQAEAAIAEADVILMISDVHVGLQDIDTRLAGLIRRRGRPVVHVVNKADGDPQDIEAASHARLGLGDVFPVASESGRGTGDMLDRLVSLLPDVSAEEADMTIRVAILGRPNVGKSSLVNALVGAERVVVSSRPGTTRDSIDTEIEYEDKRFTLVDTAGLRKRAKVAEAIEYFTTLRTISALNRSHIGVLMIEADQNFTAQDSHIAAQIIEAGKGIVIAVNKWDLLADEDHKKADRFKAELKMRAPFCDFAPIVFISALTRRHVRQVLDKAILVRSEMDKRVSTRDLNDFIPEVIERRPPPSVQGKPVRIYYITQPQTGPAKFVLFSSHPELIPDSYKRFVQNQIRERWSFTGVPVVISVRPRG
jgi:GTP-binding protein